MLSELRDLLQSDESVGSDSGEGESTAVPAAGLCAETVWDSDSEEDFGSSSGSRTVLDSPWYQWAAARRAQFGVQGAPLSLVTLCSGTDTAAHALKDLLGPDNVAVHLAVDHDEAAKRFVLLNSRPMHFFDEMKDMNDSGGACCAVCGEGCEAASSPCDICVATIPCQPFSVLNQNRFQLDYDPMATVEAQPFFQLVDWLARSPSPPGIVVVENVQGMALRSRAWEQQSPIDFVLHGEVPQANGGMRKVGLADMERYWTAPVFHFSAAECGLPLARHRIFIIMLRKDLYTVGDMNKLEKNLAELKRQTLRSEPIENFLVTDESADELPRTGKKQRTVIYQNKKADEFRRARGLPPRSARNGQPFTMNMDASQWHLLSDEQRERCDIAHLLAQKVEPTKFDAQKLAIDASKGPGMAQWKTDGRIPSLSTNSKIAYAGRVLGHRCLFKIMGWQDDSYSLPEALSGNTIQRLLGNMLCPPVIGSVCAAVLAVDKRYRLAPAKVEDTTG